jgi:hypothetical protein
LFVALLGWNRYQEWKEMNPASHRFIYRAKVRHMIAGEKQFAEENEFEKVAPHVASRYFVAARNNLNPRLSPVAVPLGLCRCYESRAAQMGELGRMALRLRGGESLDGGRGVIVAHNVGDCPQENAFAIRTGTVRKEQRMFGCDTG